MYGPILVFITGRNAGIKITQGAIFRPIGVTCPTDYRQISHFGGYQKSLTPCQISQSIYRDIGPPKLQKSRICQLIRPIGVNPLLLFTKFISFMHMLGLRKCFKFRVIRCITESHRQKTTIRQFSSKFLGASGSHPKKLGVQKWDGRPLCACKVWWRSVDAWREEVKKNGVFVCMHACMFFVTLDVQERGPDVQQHIGWRNKNVPNFRTALCNRLIKINEVKSTYLVSKYFRISVKFFA